MGSKQQNWPKNYQKRAEIDKNQEGARIHVPRELYGARIKIHLRYIYIYIYISLSYK